MTPYVQGVVPEAPFGWQFAWVFPDGRVVRVFDEGRKEISYSPTALLIRLYNDGAIETVSRVRRATPRP